MQTHPRVLLRPGNKSRVREYQRKRYGSLDQAWVNWREQRLVAQLLAECGVAGGSVLDVPCGYGRFFPLFTRLGMTVTGIDLNWEMLQLARQHPPPSTPTRLMCGTIFDLPFADNAFDAVLCIRLLHHQYSDTERYRILRELARVSRCHVLISFYRFTPLHAWGRGWAGKHSPLATLTDLQLDILAWASGLRLHCTAFLLPYIHMQTFAVLRKTPAMLRTPHTTVNGMYTTQRRR